MANASGTMSTSIFMTLETPSLTPVTTISAGPRGVPAGALTAMPSGMRSCVQPWGIFAVYSPLALTTMLIGSPATLRMKWLLSTSRGVCFTQSQVLSRPTYHVGATSSLREARPSTGAPNMSKTPSAFGCLSRVKSAPPSLILNAAATSLPLTSKICTMAFGDRLA